MTIQTQRYVKKPLHVDAVQVTPENFAEMAAWCQGQVLWALNDGELTEDDSLDPNKQYIRVRVHNPKTPRQTKAFVGDWLLYTTRGYKVYTDKAFLGSFEPAGPDQLHQPVS